MQQSCAEASCGLRIAGDDGVVAERLDLYLASKSPRRRELLTQAGIRFALCQPGEEYRAGLSEHDCEGGAPQALAQARARRKALHAEVLSRGVPVLAVDTVVDLDGRELGKAADRDAAAAVLAPASFCATTMMVSHTHTPNPHKTAPEHTAPAIYGSEKSSSPHGDMARQGTMVRHDHTIPNFTIVSNMRTHHQQAAAADTGHSART